MLTRNDEQTNTGNRRENTAVTVNSYSSALAKPPSNYEEKLNDKSAGMEGKTLASLPTLPKLSIE